MKPLLLRFRFASMGLLSAAVAAAIAGCGAIVAPTDTPPPSSELDAPPPPPEVKDAAVVPDSPPAPTNCPALARRVLFPPSAFAC